MCKNKGDGFIWHSSNAPNAAAKFLIPRAPAPAAARPSASPAVLFISKDRAQCSSALLYVDGQQVGSASNGASFDVYLTYGSHSVTFESKITGMLASGRSNADTLDVPYGARRVNVTIKVRADAVSAFGGATKLGIANVEVLR